MTLPKNNFADYPQELRNRTEKPSAVYKLDTDRFALHGTETGPPPSENAETVLSEDDKRIEIFKGNVDRGEEDLGDVGPVYSLQPGGILAVPTGSIFVRFRKGVKAAERREDIENAGYAIAQSLDYAPEAAWLRDRSGDIAAALSGVATLEKIPDVENVEPQMLMRRESR